MDWIKMHKKVMRMQRLNKYMQLRAPKKENKYFSLKMQICLNIGGGMLLTQGFYRLINRILTTIGQ
jgi:hypothetical protein